MSESAYYSSVVLNCLFLPILSSNFKQTYVKLAHGCYIFMNVVLNHLENSIHEGNLMESLAAKAICLDSFSAK